MTETLKKEIEDLISKLKLKCSINEFENRVYWEYLSDSQKLSEEFVDYFKNFVNWFSVCKYQKLSEPFIEKHQDLVNWYCITCFQQLSEKFIIKFSNTVCWFYCLSKFQKLSENFIKKYKDKLEVLTQMKSHHAEIDPIKEATEYAKKYNLKIEDGYLYAFRNHDFNGCGMWNKTLIYKSGETYTDWHCDLNKDEETTFGLGIFQKGNSPVKVKLEDFGVYLPNHIDGKARVWKFTVL